MWLPLSCGYPPPLINTLLAGARSGSKGTGGSNSVPSASESRSAGPGTGQRSSPACKIPEKQEVSKERAAGQLAMRVDFSDGRSKFGAGAQGRRDTSGSRSNAISSRHSLGERPLEA